VILNIFRISTAAPAGVKNIRSKVLKAHFASFCINWGIMHKNQSTFHKLDVGYRQVLSANANQHTKFWQLPSSIIIRIWRGFKNQKWGRLNSRHLIADKFLHAALATANTHQHTKFQLSSWISFRVMEGVPK